MKKSKLILFFILFFIFNAYINVAHPVTPDYIRTLELPSYYFGIFYSLMSIGQVIGALLFGFLSDKIGRKWIIVIGIVGYGLSQICFGYINMMPMVTSSIFRVLAGIFASAPVTLFVSMTLDISTKETNAKNLMIMSSCAILGSSVGYEVGGSLYDYANLSVQLILVVQCMIGLFIALIFALTMPNHKHNIELVGEEEKPKTRSKFSFKSLLNLNGYIYLFLFGLFVMTIGQVLINKFFDPFIIDHGFEASKLGHYILITGIISAIANITIIPLIKKIRNKKLAVLLVSFVFISAGLTFMTFLIQTNIMYLLFTTHLAYLILKTMIMPLEQNEIASYSNLKNNGQIMGARQTVLSIANCLGPLIGSAINATNEVISPLTFIVAASVMLGSTLIYIIYFILKYKPRNETVKQN